jgi:hypothetical protein
VSYNTHGKIGNGVPSEICTHGHLARSCERCDDQARIAVLESIAERAQCDICGRRGVVGVCVRCNEVVCVDCMSQTDVCYECTGGDE